MCTAQTKGATSGKKASSDTAPADLHVVVTLNRLMRGIFYPNSNIVFAAQYQNPADVPQSKYPSAATDPLMGSFGSWTAVENGALVIAESTNLLLLPGRKCSNGRDVPIMHADWPVFVQGLRQAAMNAYHVAQERDQRKMQKAGDALVAACVRCHNVYRPNDAPQARCK